MAKQVSTDVLFKIVDDIAANHANALSDSDKYAVAQYITEKRRGAESRVFEYSHPNEYATLARLAADFMPREHTMSDVQQTRIGESIDYAAYIEAFDTRLALRQIALKRALQKLSEAMGYADEREEVTLTNDGGRIVITRTTG